jgi:hypothetical protein
MDAKTGFQAPAGAPRFSRKPMPAVLGFKTLPLSVFVVRIVLRPPRAAAKIRADS